MQVTRPAFSFSTRCCPGKPWHHGAPEGPAGQGVFSYKEASPLATHQQIGSEASRVTRKLLGAGTLRRRASFPRGFGAKRPSAASSVERERARKRGSGWLAPSLPQQQQPRQRLPRGSSLAPLASAQPLSFARSSASPLPAPPLDLFCAATSGA